MKKTILILMGVLAAAAFADRTANRDWVGQNFAPSNLVPRVEAVEDALTNGTRIAIGKGAVAMTNETVQIGAGTNATAGTLQFRSWPLVDSDGKIPKERLSAMDETDPTFTAWTNGEKIAVGKSAVASKYGAVAIGSYAEAKASYSIAIGSESRATAEYAVQLGSGCNSTYGSLQFGEWTLLDEFGKIPAARLPSDGGSIPRTSEEAITVGPLVLGQDTVYIAPGVCRMNGPAWKRSSWELDSGAMYTSADWNFSDSLWIGVDGIWLERDDLLHFKSGKDYLSVDDKVKSVITPAVVLEKIKAMNDTQKAELKAFLGIE